MTTYPDAEPADRADAAAAPRIEPTSEAEPDAVSEHGAGPDSALVAGDLDLQDANADDRGLESDEPDGELTDGNGEVDPHSIDRFGTPADGAPTRAGFAALIGAPNAGKSTLTNQIVGAKVSIVTHKVQTTRTRIRGICMVGAAQLILIDTPGIFAP
ncbi:MAG: GTPase, partial [Pseudomonadota bacterium]